MFQTENLDCFSFSVASLIQDGHFLDGQYSNYSILSASQKSSLSQSTALSKRLSRTFFTGTFLHTFVLHNPSTHSPNLAETKPFTVDFVDSGKKYAHSKRSRHRMSSSKC